MSEFDRKRLDAALSGDSAALRTIIGEMTPVVRARVTRAVGRRRGFDACNLANEASDLMQEVFATLFSADAKALRAWDPQRGLSFLNFVGLIAQRRAAEIMRTQRWSRQAQEQPLQESQLQVAQRNVHDYSSEEMLKRLLEYLEATLTDRGLEMFERLYLRNESIEHICAETGLNAQAVYQWRARLAKAAREGMQELSADAKPRSIPAAGSPKRERRAR